MSPRSMKPRFDDVKHRGIAAIQEWMRNSNPDEIKIVWERIDMEITVMEEEIEKLREAQKGLIPLPEWYWSGDDNAPDTWIEYRGKEDEV
ncbi:MAG: hypothetical protein CXX81_14085 [Methanobacteriota archaeon]|nr:MAG: hypothetical protein CXX81_14085 [Euryarchaeota archaeon]